MAVNQIPSAVANIGQLPKDRVPGGTPLAGKGPSFADALRQQGSFEKSGVEKASLASSLKFSNHAVERMRTRGVNFNPETMSKIESAVEMASQKGAKETLVLTDNSALIVSVENKTVVTVMDKAALKDRVFTNVDSTVMV